MRCSVKVTYNNVFYTCTIVFMNIFLYWMSTVVPNWTRIGCHTFVRCGNGNHNRTIMDKRILRRYFLSLNELKSKEWHRLSDGSWRKNQAHSEWWRWYLSVWKWGGILSIEEACLQNKPEYIRTMELKGSFMKWLILSLDSEKRWHLTNACVRHNTRILVLLCLR